MKLGFHVVALCFGRQRVMMTLVDSDQFCVKTAVSSTQTVYLLATNHASNDLLHSI